MEISEFFIFASFGIVRLPGVSEHSKFTEYSEFLYSEFSENYEKMTLKSNFYFHEKLAPTRIFEFEFGMQGLTFLYPNLDELRI